MSNIGYARVSTPDQHLDEQIRQLEAEGCTKIFSEKASGGTEKRPELQAMLEFIRPGDCIVICKLDRLARSLSHLLRLVDAIETQGAGLRSIAESVIDTGSPHGKLLMQIFGCISEFERSLISERTKEGLVRAKALGRMRGKPQKLSPEQKTTLQALRGQGYSFGQLAHTFGISRSTARDYAMGNHLDSVSAGS